MDAEKVGDASNQPPPTCSQQSQLDREANYENVAEQVGNKLASDPSNITSEDGDILHSREVRAFGASEKGGLASQAHSQAAENMGVKKNPSNTAGGVTPTLAQKSQVDREVNLEDVAQRGIEKMQMGPTSVTKEDGDLLHSRETRATGTTEKGGLASQVQSQPAENMGVKK